jgi:hypothetical protein
LVTDRFTSNDDVARGVDGCSVCVDIRGAWQHVRIPAIEGRIDSPGGGEPHHGDITRSSDSHHIHVAGWINEQGCLTSPADAYRGIDHGDPAIPECCVQDSAGGEFDDLSLCLIISKGIRPCGDKDVPGRIHRQTGRERFRSSAEATLAVFSKGQIGRSIWIQPLDLQILCSPEENRPPGRIHHRRRVSIMHRLDPGLDGQAVVKSWVERPDWRTRHRRHGRGRIRIGRTNQPGHRQRIRGPSETQDFDITVGGDGQPRQSVVALSSVQAKLVDSRGRTAGVERFVESPACGQFKHSQIDRRSVARISLLGSDHLTVGQDGQASDVASHERTAEQATRAKGRIDNASRCQLDHEPASTQINISCRIRCDRCCACL